MSIEILQKDYLLKKDRIQSRLREFEQIIPQGDEKIFEELCFCILTANTSAKAGIKSIEYLKPILLIGDQKQLTNALISSGYRFPNKRAEYIIEARNFLQKELNFKLKEKIQSFQDKESLRLYIIKNIKGLGPKETSHFLRNIGFKGYSILDKHIINTLHEYQILNQPTKPKNYKHYLEIEQKYKEFAKSLNINEDELDLLLWSRKNGEILK